LRRAAAAIAATALVAPPADAKGLDTAKLDKLRSLIAEAVVVERAAASGRVTQTYEKGLREELGQGLQKLLNAPGLGGAAKAAMQSLEARDAAGLAALRDRLVTMERSHGRAG
jgi:hypothetical protein